MDKETEKILDSIIIIKNISVNFTSDCLTREFSKFGRIQMFDVNIKNKFAVVKYHFKSEAMEAIEKMNGRQFSGMYISVQKADCVSEPVLKLLKLCVKVQDREESETQKEKLSNIDDSTFSTQNEFDEVLSDSSEEIIFEQCLSLDQNNNEDGSYLLELTEVKQIGDKYQASKVIDYKELESSTLSLTDSQTENRCIDLDFSFGKKNPQKKILKKYI